MADDQDAYTGPDFKTAYEEGVYANLVEDGKTPAEARRLMASSTYQLRRNQRFSDMGMGSKTHPIRPWYAPWDSPFTRDWLFWVFAASSALALWQIDHGVSRSNPVGIFLGLYFWLVLVPGRVRQRRRLRSGRLLPRTPAQGAPLS